jgi:hydroxyacylglutathione hydrolase
VDRTLRLIGLDRITGHFSEFAGRGGESVPQMSVDDLVKKQSSSDAVVIDVRHDHEWNEGHIPNAIHIPLGQLAQRLKDIPQTDNVVVHCQGGGRSAIAASLLQKLGRKNVANLTGGYKAWKAR